MVKTRGSNTLSPSPRLPYYFNSRCSASHGVRSVSFMMKLPKKKKKKSSKKKMRWTRMAAMNSAKMSTGKIAERVMSSEKYKESL